MAIFKKKKDADDKKAAPKEEKKTAAKKDTDKKDASKGKVWHVTLRDGKPRVWVVKAEGATRAYKTFNTKAEAEECVRKLKANNDDATVVIHKKDGKFQKK